MTTNPPRRRGRPLGSKNKPKPEVAPAPSPSRPRVPAPAPVADAPADTPTPVHGTTRAALETRRAGLLADIAELRAAAVPDRKTIATLETTLNGLDRMLLRITGEAAPSATDLLRSPQVVQFVDVVLGALRAHPAALADVRRALEIAK